MNDLRETEKKKCEGLVIDEALMNNFGAIAMATKLAEANEIFLTGDMDQVPYMDRNNSFNILYSRPSMVVNITQELLCTHRAPMVVAYALNEIYDGIYTSSNRIRSMELMSFAGTVIPKSKLSLCTWPISYVLMAGMGTEPLTVAT